MRFRLVVAAFLAILILPALAAANPASAPSNRRAVPAPTAPDSLSREAIRQMPLLERPDRPGHVYGNTVRRMHRWRTGGR